MTSIIVMSIFTVAGIGGGVCILRWAVPLADFFKTGADMAYSEKITKRVYTPSNVRQAGVGFILFGCLTFVILLVLIFR
ncbi:hypothetical protein SCB71_15505 [Herbiconiux sp. KACC 21604]|uniref:hypothetical protein n=1 Tax=unclassified Herbiconiux TaxID=2618217 RepID=UPI0014917E39|nr:hypothetical protein [Herbiconiux sp. SALV-R1]QJU54533.1 hypothetical protein HL652_13450 [Herbiconiux sp. SALV-R1]WPO85616.1 hypothetical protein SCB71_15505 [Herbiconiux sp. KACC 21604]